MPGGIAWRTHACTLARRQHDQPRALLQIFQASNHVDASHSGNISSAVLEPEPRFVIDNGAVTNEVENVLSTVAQAIREIVKSGSSAGGKRGHANAAHTRPRPGRFALHIDGCQLKLRQVSWVGDHHQRSKLDLRAKAHRLPVQTAQITRKDNLLALEQVASVAWVQQCFPMQTVQLRRVRLYPKMNLQIRPQGLSRGASLVKSRCHGWVLEQTVGQKFGV